MVDEFGEAISLYPVMVEAMTDSPTGRPIATTQTNDRGEFRIAGLRPGTVAVAAVDVRASVNVFTAPGADGQDASGISQPFVVVWGSSTSTTRHSYW